MTVAVHLLSDLTRAVASPLSWVHTTSDEEPFTKFWRHELFRPDVLDTFPEPTHPQE